MKCSGLLLILNFLFATFSFGQDVDQIKLDISSLYVVITSFADTIKGHVILIEPGEFYTINVIKGPDGIKKYGAEGSFGVIEVKLKPHVKVFNLTSFKKFQHIEQYKKVNISIDGRPLSSESLIVTEKAVKDVKKQVIKQNEEIDIEITSRHPIPRYVPGQGPVIRGNPF